MTTVNVYIRRVDDPVSLSLHVGAIGPASGTLHALIEAFRESAISGHWHASYIDTTAPGEVIRSMLAGVHELDPTFHRASDWHRLAAFLEALEDDAEYAVKAIAV